MSKKIIVLKMDGKYLKVPYNRLGIKQIVQFLEVLKCTLRFIKWRSMNCAVKPEFAILLHLIKVLAGSYKSFPGKNRS